MAFYKLKENIEAVRFTEGMEDGWRVYYWGNLFEYKKDFKTKQEALDFISQNKGLELAQDEDIEYGEINYEDPMPLINAEPVKVGDYIATINGVKHIMSEEKFESIYEEV